MVCGHYFSNSPESRNMFIIVVNMNNKECFYFPNVYMKLYVSYQHILIFREHIFRAKVCGKR